MIFFHAMIQDKVAITNMFPDQSMTGCLDISWTCYDQEQMDNKRDMVFYIN